MKKMLLRYLLFLISMVVIHKIVPEEYKIWIIGLFIIVTTLILREIEMIWKGKRED